MIAWYFGILVVRESFASIHAIRDPAAHKGVRAELECWFPSWRETSGNVGLRLNTAPALQCGYPDPNLIWSRNEPEPWLRLSTAPAPGRLWINKSE